MNSHVTGGASCAEKEAQTLEAEAKRLDELADLREEHAREERDEAEAHKAHIEEDLEEIARRREHGRQEEEEIAHDEAEARHEEGQAKRDREEADRLREEARRKREDGHHSHHLVKITAVVAGKDVVIEARKEQTLAEIRDEALKLTENVGQPPENWEIKDEHGNLLEAAKRVGDFSFGCEVTLFITLRAGAAGDGQTVDPEVSRAKFDRELEIFHKMEATWRQRGIFLLEANFPKASFLIVTTKTKPSTIAAAIEIDFSDFDLRPPSVRFVDPFDGSPTRMKDLRLLMLRRTGSATPQHLGGLPAVDLQSLIQANSPDDFPFICLPGIREYHDNPAHTGDQWLLHRTSGAGSLDFILDKIWMYGSNTVENLAFQIHFQPIVTGYAPNPQNVPA